MKPRRIFRLAGGLALVAALLVMGTAAQASSTIYLCGSSDDGTQRVRIGLNTKANFNLLTGNLYGEMEYTGPGGRQDYVIHGAGYMRCDTDDVTLRGTSVITDTPASLKVLKGHMTVQYDYIQGRHVISSAGSSLMAKIYSVNLVSDAAETSYITIGLARCKK